MIKNPNLSHPFYSAKYSGTLCGFLEHSFRYFNILPGMSNYNTPFTSLLKTRFSVLLKKSRGYRDGQGLKRAAC